jgi:hypothetical protein
MFEGMIYMEPSSLGWEPLLRSWIAKSPPILNEWLKQFLYESLFLRFCKPIFYLLRRYGVSVRFSLRYRKKLKRRKKPKNPNLRIQII